MLSVGWVESELYWVGKVARTHQQYLQTVFQYVKQQTRQHATHNTRRLAS